MIKRVIRVTILVRDQDEALRWYSERLGFKKVADEPLGPGAHWLTVAPRDQKELQIVLLRPDAAVQGKKMAQESMRRIGKGTAWVLEVDNCQKTYEELASRGVRFAGAPEERPYGVEAVFEDLYGNPWVLPQPK
jgi:catechol 2,3-dioxygenase-like lactoylglutathione lyase family enzyme